MLMELLAACCCEADRQKIEYIYLHYGKIIFYVINRRIGNQKTSEDLTHDLFVRLIEMADRIDLADLKKLRSLLVILAKHTAIDYERKQMDSLAMSGMLSASATSLSPAFLRKFLHMICVTEIGRKR